MPDQEQAMTKLEPVEIAHAGRRLLGEVARPKGAGPFPAVLVMASAYGLGEQVRRSARALAARGWIGLCNDMYGDGAYFADPSGAGPDFSALMANPPVIAKLVAAVVAAVDIPVTLKIRSGPDSEHETAPETARLAELAGASAVDVHARSVAQSYVGGPDWTVVARVKQSVKIPVFGSGGVREATDASRFLKETGADGVAIGRGCLGNPWIFQQARALYQGGAVVAAPHPYERARVLLQLAEGEFDFYGNHLALKRLPRVACYFAKFLPDFASFRNEVQKVNSFQEFKRLIRQHFVQ